MQADQETSLRSFLTKRFAQHQPLTSSGNIISIPAGKVYDQNAMVYFHFMTEGNYDSQTEDDFTSSRCVLKFLYCHTLALCIIAQKFTSLFLAIFWTLHGVQYIDRANFL